MRTCGTLKRTLGKKNHISSFMASQKSSFLKFSLSQLKRDILKNCFMHGLCSVLSSHYGCEWRCNKTLVCIMHIEVSFHLMLPSCIFLVFVAVYREELIWKWAKYFHLREPLPWHALCSASYGIYFRDSQEMREHILLVAPCLASYLESFKHTDSCNTLFWGWQTFKGKKVCRA